MTKKNSFESKRKKLSLFIEKEKRLPVNRTKEERSLYYWYNKNINEDSVRLLVRDYLPRKTNEEWFLIVKNFIKEKGRFPKQNKEEGVLYRWVRNNRDLLEGEPFYIENENKFKSHNDRVLVFKDFLIRENRMPSQINKSEKVMYNWYMRNKDKKEVSELANEYKQRRYKFSERLKQLEVFYRDKGRFPKKEDNKGLANWCYANKKDKRLKAKIKEIEKK